MLVSRRFIQRFKYNPMLVHSALFQVPVLQHCISLLQSKKDWFAFTMSDGELHVSVQCFDGLLSSILSRYSFSPLFSLGPGAVYNCVVLSMSHGGLNPGGSSRQVSAVLFLMFVPIGIQPLIFRVYQRPLCVSLP